MKAKSTYIVILAILAIYLLFAPGSRPGCVFAEETKAEDGRTQTMKVTAYVAPEKTAPPKSWPGDDAGKQSQVKTGDKWGIKGGFLLLGGCFAVILFTVRKGKKAK